MAFYIVADDLLQWRIQRGALGASAPPPHEPSLKKIQPLFFYFPVTCLRYLFHILLGLTKLPRELEVTHGDASVYSNILLSV